MSARKGHWVQDEDEGLVIVCEGKRIVPSGLDIWSAQFEGTNRFHGVEVSRPSKDLPNITFAPDFADIGLLLHHVEGGRPFVSLELRNLSEKPQLPVWPKLSQILCNDQWFAVEGTQLNSMRSLLDDRGVQIGSALTEEQMLWLTWVSDLPVRISRTTRRQENQVAGEINNPLDLEGLIEGVLYPYQVEGVGRLARLYQQRLGCLLADEMGLGKTLQVIALLSYATHNDGGPNLVIAPSSTLANWIRELETFAPHLSVYLHTGGSRTGDPRVLSSYDVVVVSYDTSVQDEFLFTTIKWNVIGLDEAQYAKNPDSQRAQLLRKTDSTCLVAITGTPIENTLVDMWSIMELVAPAYLGSRDTFDGLFPDENGAAKELSLRVAPLTIRRRVKDVATDLPDRSDIYVPIFPNADLAMEHERIRSDASDPLSKLAKLRMLCARFAGQKIPSKSQRATSLVIEAFTASQKVIIFASFTSTLDEMLSDFRSRFPGAYVAIIDGRVAVESRQAIIDDFSTHSGPAVLLLNPKAAGVGLNIQAANVVIHFTPEWNPAVVDQASARAHRRGQDKPVFVYYLFYSDTIEQNMLNLVEKKRDLQAHGVDYISNRGDQLDIKMIEGLLTAPIEGHKYDHR